MVGVKFGLVCLMMGVYLTEVGVGQAGMVVVPAEAEAAVVAAVEKGVGPQLFVTMTSEGKVLREVLLVHRSEVSQ